MAAGKALARLSLLALLFAASPSRAQAPELAPLAPQPARLKPPPWLRKAQKGSLVVKSKTQGAQVQVDGLDVGTVPLAPLQLPPGKHEVRVSKAGHRELSQRVTIKAGKTVTVKLDLKKLKGAPPPELPALPSLVAPVASQKIEVSAADPALPALPALPEPAPIAPAAQARQAPAVAQPIAQLAQPVAQAPAAAALPPAAKVAGPPPAQKVAAAEAPAKPAAIDAAPTPLALAAAPAAPVARPTTVPAEAIAAPSDAAVPLTKRWYFWGGAAAVAAVVAAGVVYALPAKYVERRDPAAACGGACGVVINK